MNLIRVLMTILFPLITYPYATRVLNSAGVGRAAYVASIVSYFQLIASFGVNNYAITAVILPNASRIKSVMIKQN